MRSKTRKKKTPKIKKRVKLGTRRKKLKRKPRRRWLKKLAGRGKRLRARRKKPGAKRKRKGSVPLRVAKPKPSSIAAVPQTLAPPRPPGKHLRILVWSTIMSLGGGTRVLANLLPAIARQEGVELLRVVISSRSNFKSVLDSTPYPNLIIDEFDGSIDSPQAQPFLQQADVVYFFWPHGLDVPSLPMPTVCTIQDLTVLDFAAPFALGHDLKHYWAQMKGWVDQSTSLIAAAQDVKNRMISHFGERCHQAYTIPFTHSSKLADPSPERTGTAAQLPAEYIVYPANTSPHKNHYNLLLAYSRFAYRKQIPLVLIGFMTDELRRVPPDYPEIAYLPTLTTLIKRKGLVHGEDFFALGFIPDTDITSVLKHSKALIMPSLSEGGGIPLFEALGLGVPVLCSDIPVFREHVGNEGRADSVLWFDPDSPDSIADSLTLLVSDYGRYQNIAQNSSHGHIETWDDTARKYVDVFFETHRRYHGY